MAFSVCDWRRYFFLSVSIVLVGVVASDVVYISLYAEMLPFSVPRQPSTYTVFSPALKMQGSQH